MKLEQPILLNWMHGTWKKKELNKVKKLNKTKRKERDWFWSLDDNHALYPFLYTPTFLPMIPRPGTQALVVSRADKIVISASFASSLVRNNIFSTKWKKKENLQVTT